MRMHNRYLCRSPYGHQRTRIEFEISGRAEVPDTREWGTGMNLIFLSVVIITALIYFFVSPDFFKNRYIKIRACLAIAAAVGSFVVLYILQLPFTGFNLLLWFLINAAIALGLNSALTNHPKGAIVSGVSLAVIILFWFCWYYHSFRHDCNPDWQRHRT